MDRTARHRDWRVRDATAESRLLPRPQMSFDLPGCRGSTGYRPVGIEMAHSWFDGAGSEAFEVEAGTGEPELLCMLPQAGRFVVDSSASNLQARLHAEGAMLMVVPSSRGVFRNPPDTRVLNTTCHFGPVAIGHHFDDHFDLADVCRRAATDKSFEGTALSLRFVPRLTAIGRELLLHPFIGRAAELFLESRFVEVAAIILDTLSTRKTDRPRRYPFQRTERDRLDEARERLALNLTDPPNLDTLATQVGLGRNRLVAGFRERFGAAPFEWLRHTRLTKARHMLETDAVSVSEVAADCGYAHLSSFSAAFRARFGKTPQSISDRSGKKVPCS